MNKIDLFPFGSISFLNGWCFYDAIVTKQRIKSVTIHCKFETHFIYICIKRWPFKFCKQFSYYFIALHTVGILCWFISKTYANKRHFNDYKKRQCQQLILHVEITIFFKFEMYGISYLLCLIVQNNKKKMNEHNNNRKEKSGTKFVAKSNKE